MKKTTLVSLCFFTVFTLTRASVLPISLNEQVRQSAAVFRGTVASVHSYVSPSDGFIYTRTALRVDETFKGKLPPMVQLVHRGGEVGGRGEANDLSPQFKVGEERLIFVGRRTDGTLFARRGDAGAIKLAAVAPNSGVRSGSAGEMILEQLRAMTVGGNLPGGDLNDQAGAVENISPENNPTPLTTPSSLATNLMVGSDGIPARFLQPDRAENIPYYVDADYLPSGITLTQALNAVQSALAAWTNVTSLRYQFMGVQSFGEAAGNVPVSDGRLLIQLHDHYNSIGGGGTLGVGGHGWVIANTPSGWTTGGNVRGSDFHKVTGGSVAILNTSSFFTGNPTNLAEVLCHEIGHTIGLGHSSEDPSETNPLLSQAIMYYTAHGNGRGAALNQWDINVVRQVHPQTNLPPWCCDRVLDAIHSPVAFTTPGVNAVEMRGYELEAKPLTFIAADQSSINGSFSVTTNGIVTYQPFGWYGSDSARLDPAGNSYWDMIFARWSDGMNASPFATLRVVSLLSDYYGEGIPDSWRLAYFGSANPSAGPNRHATNDFDGDGFNNITEFRLGSNPADKNSNLRLLTSPTNLQWLAKGYEVYELSSSTNLHDWARWGNPITPTNFVPGTDIFNLTNSIGIVTNVANGGPLRFFRLFKVQ